MEAQKFCMNIGSTHARLKLPIGYRFHPTDEELVFYYLRPMVFGIPLPSYVIPHFDVFLTNPWDLPGDAKEKRYFFSRNDQRNLDDKRSKIGFNGLGFWKHTGKGKQINVPGTNKIVATRKTLVFRQRKRSCHGLKTRWFMHTYQLSAQMLPNNIALEDWVVYCVFQRKRRSKKFKAIPESSIHHNLCNIDPQSYSSCSSAVTVDSSNALDEEASSGYRGLSS